MSDDTTARVISSVLALPEIVDRLDQRLTALDNDRLTPLAYRPDDVLKVLPISRDVLFKLLRTGQIESFQEGTARLIPRQALLDYITRRLDQERQRNADVKGAA